MRDEYGFTIAAKGNTYPVNNKTLLIEKVIKYGYKGEYLVALVTDKNKAKYCVVFSKNVKNVNDFIVNVYVENKYQYTKMNKWVNIDGNDDFIQRLALYRNYSMLLLIVLFILVIYYVTKSFKSRRVKSFHLDGLNS